MERAQCEEEADLMAQSTQSERPPMSKQSVLVKLLPQPSHARTSAGAAGAVFGDGFGGGFAVEAKSWGVAGSKVTLVARGALLCASAPCLRQ